MPFQKIIAHLWIDAWKTQNTFREIRVFRDNPRFRQTHTLCYTDSYYFTLFDFFLDSSPLFWYNYNMDNDKEESTLEEIRDIIQAFIKSTTEIAFLTLAITIVHSRTLLL